jgi:hypothetical protein
MNILAFLKIFRRPWDVNNIFRQAFTFSCCQDVEAAEVEKRDPEKEAYSAVNIQAGLMDLVSDKNFEGQADQAAGISKFTDSLLHGTPEREAGTENVKYGDPGFMGAIFQGRPDIKSAFHKSKGAGDGRTFEEWFSANEHRYQDVVQFGVDKTITAREGTRGLTDILTDVQDNVMDLKDQWVGGELDTLKKYAGTAMEALRLADPAAAELLDQTTAAVTQQLADAQGPLSDQTYNDISQPILGNMAASGFGTYDPAAQKAIFRQTDAERQNRLGRAEQAALTTVAARDRHYGDPYQQITGRSSGREAQGITGMANSQYQDIIDPFNPAIMGAFADNVGNTNAANIAYTNNQAAAAAAPWGFAGDILGGLAGGAAQGLAGRPRAAATPKITPKVTG